MAELIEKLAGTALFAVWVGAGGWLWWQGRAGRRVPSPLADDAAQLARHHPRRRLWTEEPDAEPRDDAA